MFAFVSAGINAAKSAYRSLAQRSKVSAGTGECQTPGQCFIAGTLVLTAAGLKPIEEIEVGDEVLAYDEETGEQAYKPVTRLFRNTTEEWYHIRVNGEEIVCTGGHPFYILNAGSDRNIVNFEGVKSNGVGKWICARELRVSDKVLLSDGSCGIIETIEVETLSAPATTYNFEVADFHTYYVSESNVLVHNDCITDGLTKIANKYDDFQCVECAEEMKSFLLKKGIQPEQVQIQFSGIGAHNNVWSESLGRVISYNGYHTGIVYKGIVYDNLFKTGLAYSSWVDDFIGFGVKNLF